MRRKTIAKLVSAVLTAVFFSFVEPGQTMFVTAVMSMTLYEVGQLAILGLFPEKKPVTVHKGTFGDKYGLSRWASEKIS